MNALQYIEKFKTTPAWAEMEATFEDSPWHREESVAKHTEMVLGQYAERFLPHRTEEQNKIALLALLYHDVGKPVAEEIVTNETRGTYRRYSGHEQQSAVAFTEAWLADADLRELLSPVEARAVRWLIEHHLPYGLKDTNKVGMFRAATRRTLGDMEQTFYDCLRSDAAGRISDDHETKLQNVEDWIHNFKKVAPLHPKMATGQTAYVLIGPSGSGKSTWMKSKLKEGDEIISLDKWRLDYLEQIMYGDDNTKTRNTKKFYKMAWETASQEQVHFNIFVDKQHAAAMERAEVANGNIFIDNVNATRKSRAKWIQAARQSGMQVVAVEFWNPLSVLVERQQSRTDKEVPASAVQKQQDDQTCSWLGGEVDAVIIVANGSERLGSL